MPEAPVMSRDEQSDTEPIAIEVRRLRHPSEPSRFALAASASILFVGLGVLLAVRLTGVIVLGSLGLIVLMACGLIWWTVQVHRARLLGARRRGAPRTRALCRRA